ncbi:hypothetical protein LUZ60_011142 [Juncus effusus]|nr:hypothetical protein LUZ60_011142 [Juncus effusus]
MLMIILFISLLFSFFTFISIPKMIKKSLSFAKKEETPTMAEVEEISLFDLPELTLELILEKLPPISLCKISCVAISLRNRCNSDHLWRKHMEEKWVSLLGEKARKEWDLYKEKTFSPKVEKSKSYIDTLACFWPISWMKSKIDCGNDIVQVSESESDSIKSWYLALETGKFWFPAQVFNRENGHVGFVLSCYDAYLSYDRQTDTFFARYPPHGTKPVKTESQVQWNRVRAPQIQTSSHELHVSDCLKDLKPGDCFEIQWRKNKEFPYGWWYGVVGHLESCDETDRFCRCHEDDTIILEFKQYARGSRWRKMKISRKDHREKGDENDGFYGGIRKLGNNEEIKMWKQFWPAEIID